MAFTNFKLDIDADGIALVIWDMPGRSMNVLDDKVIEELGAIVDQTAADAAVKGVVITSAKDAFSAGADLTMLEGLSRAFAEMALAQGEEAAIAELFAQSRKLSQLYPAAGDERQALGRRDQRHGAWRRARALPRLPSSRRVRQCEDARRPARDQDRPVPRRGRHPARGAHDAAGRRPADAAQGRATESRPRQGDEADRRRRAAGGSDQDREGMDQGRRQGRRALGRAGLQASRRSRLFQGRDDDLPRGQCDLPPRDLRQLSRRTRHPAGGLRRPATADGSGAAGGVALVRESAAHAGSGGDDPLALCLHAGVEQGRAAAGGSAAVEAQHRRRHRRGLHGRGHRLCHRDGRHRQSS